MYVCVLSRELVPPPQKWYNLEPYCHDRCLHRQYFLPSYCKNCKPIPVHIIYRYLHIHNAFWNRSGVLIDIQIIIPIYTHAPIHARAYTV